MGARRTGTGASHRRHVAKGLTHPPAGAAAVIFASGGAMPEFVRACATYSLHPAASGPATHVRPERREREQARKAARPTRAQKPHIPGRAAATASPLRQCSPPLRCPSEPAGFPHPQHQTPPRPRKPHTRTPPMPPAYRPRARGASTLQPPSSLSPRSLSAVVRSACARRKIFARSARGSLPPRNPTPPVCITTRLPQDLAGGSDRGLNARAVGPPGGCVGA